MAGFDIKTPSPLEMSQSRNNLKIGNIKSTSTDQNVTSKRRNHEKTKSGRQLYFNEYIGAQNISPTTPNEQSGQASNLNVESPSFFASHRKSDGSQLSFTEREHPQFPHTVKDAQQMQALINYQVEKKLIDFEQ